MSLQLLILKKRQLDIVDIHFSLEVLPHYHHRNFFFLWKKILYCQPKKQLGKEDYLCILYCFYGTKIITTGNYFSWN